MSLSDKMYQPDIFFKKDVKETIKELKLHIKLRGHIQTGDQLAGNILSYIDEIFGGDLV